VLSPIPARGIVKGGAGMSVMPTEERGPRICLGFSVAFCRERPPDSAAVGFFIGEFYQRITPHDPAGLEPATYGLKAQNQGSPKQHQGALGAQRHRVRRLPAPPLCATRAVFPVCEGTVGGHSRSRKNSPRSHENLAECTRRSCPFLRGAKLAWTSLLRDELRRSTPSTSRRTVSNLGRSWHQPSSARAAASSMPCSLREIRELRANLAAKHPVYAHGVRIDLRRASRWTLVRLRCVMRLFSNEYPPIHSLVSSEPDARPARTV